jgi:hypothetical protein
MPQTLSPGPYKKLTIDGQQVPWYIIPFDKEGWCTGPRTRDDLIATLRKEQYTDIFVFSHGWNNDWKVASGRYDEFIESYGKLRLDHHLSYPQPRKSLLTGIFWPSTALVMPSESGPAFAGTSQDDDDAERQKELEELAELIPPDKRDRFYELIQQDEPLDEARERELAEILAPLWNDLQKGGSVDMPVSPVTAADLLKLWQAGRSVATDDDEFGGLAGAVGAAAPAAALSLGGVLNAPRDLVRAFTVLQMKDRAVRVGGSGVSRLLRDMLAASRARVHLIGHSYGCVVVLSALCSIPAPELKRKVHSALLLQPAVSRFCFAERVPGKSYPGGYRDAFGRLVQPILTTFSKHDVPLTSLFHLAVRRDEDLGQPIVAGPPPAPSKYAALGGFGPDGCRDGEYEIRDIHSVGNPYALTSQALRVIALRADNAIGGHGDISVPETWWALYNQVLTT